MTDPHELAARATGGVEDVLEFVVRAMERQVAQLP
jgi:hypothetical protein